MNQGDSHTYPRAIDEFDGDPALATFVRSSRAVSSGRSHDDDPELTRFLETRRVVHSVSRFDD